MKLSLLLILLISVEALPQQVATNEKELKRLAGFSFRRALEPLIATEFENLAEVAGRFSRKETRGPGGWPSRSYTFKPKVRVALAPAE